MNNRDRKLLLKAAALFECIAEDIYTCNTVDGVWDPEAKEDKREHKDFIATASRLRVLAKSSEPGGDQHG
jgi:hypothetical protein